MTKRSDENEGLGAEAVNDSTKAPGRSHGESEMTSWEEDVDDSPRMTRMTLPAIDAEALAPIFFTALFLSTIVALFYVLSSFLADAVISFILLGLFRKPYQRTLKRVGGNRWLASAVMTFLIVVLLLVPLSGFLYALTAEASLAYDTLSLLFADGGEGVVDRSMAWSEASGIHLTREAIVDYVAGLVSGMNSLAVDLGGTLFGNLLSFTVHAATTVVMIFYLFADGERLRAFMFRLSPLPDNEDALLVETFRKVSRGVIVGNGLGSVIQGILGGFAMWAVDLHSPLLWGAVMTVFAFLPLVGITVVVIPATLVLVLRGEPGVALAFCLFCFAVGTFVDNVVKTKLMGSAMRMHDLLVFLSIIGGLSAFGVIGFIYGPLIAMLFMTLHGLYEQHYLPELAQNFALGRSLNRSAAPSLPRDENASS